MNTVDALGMDREGRIAALKDNIPVGWKLCETLEVHPEAMYFCYKAEDGLSTGTWEHPEFGDRVSAVHAGTIFIEPLPIIPSTPLPQTATEVTRSMDEQDPVLVAERKAAADLSDDFMLLMAEWEKADQEATLAVERERDLRVRIARAAFAAPKEGTNSFALRNGYVLKGKFDIRRIVDIASLATVREMMTEKGYNTDDCVRMKPELALTAFKALPEEAKKIMSLAITEKPGLPSLEIVLPKRAAR